MGIPAAALVALAARRAGQLTTSGAFAAALLGSLAMVAGWRWGVLLIAYFLSSALLSSWRSGQKRERTGDLLAKGGARDAWQVAANGAPFAMGMLAMTLMPPSPAWAAFAVGGLAASASDTWATEIGTALGRDPVEVRTLRRVAAGTSGAVSAAGLGGALLGASAIALASLALGAAHPVASAAFAGGLLGSTLDTLAGAWLQERRRCVACGVLTERASHCDAATAHAAGVRGITNDAVNAGTALAGAAFAGLLAT